MIREDGREHGEMLALRFDDVDFERGRITLRVDDQEPQDSRGAGWSRIDWSAVGGTMLRCISLVLAIAFAAAGASAQDNRFAKPVSPEATREPVRADVRGVWKVTELASRAPGEEWEAHTAPYLSQYIFTGQHYSYMYVPGAGPRRSIAGDPNKPTDAEKVEAYNSFVAASGTYQLSGRSLTMVALVHKNPNEMDGEPLTYTVELDGNSLRMTIANPPFLPGRERRTVLTRVE